VYSSILQYLYYHVWSDAPNIRLILTYNTVSNIGSRSWANCKNSIFNQYWIPVRSPIIVLQIYNVWCYIAYQTVSKLRGSPWGNLNCTFWPSKWCGYKEYGSNLIDGTAWMLYPSSVEARLMNQRCLRRKLSACYCLTQAILGRVKRVRILM
jgi:hypothetical protein